MLDEQPLEEDFMTTALNIDWTELGNEASKVLSDLIQFDTTNPPGNERIAAEYLARFLENEGIESELLEPLPQRTSILARLKGSRPGPKLMLLSHTDVVPATNPNDWEQPPFSGAIEDNYIWGRGALDMKSMTAMELLVFVLFKRLNLDFAGELIFLAVADEETGGDHGAEWLAKEHRKKVQADYVLNEGGGMPIEIGRKTFYTIETVEKGIWWVRVKMKGTAGHASIPHDDNPLVKSAQLIERIASHPFPKIISPSVQEYFEKIGSAMAEGGRAVEMLLSDAPHGMSMHDVFDGTAVNPFMANAFLQTTCSPTMMTAGVKANVIPDSCEFVLDFRYVPGYSIEEILDVLEGYADELNANIEIEEIQHSPPSESSKDTDLYRVIEEIVSQEIPGTECVPYLMTGATDSRFMREIGAVAYGFTPLTNNMSMTDRGKLVHSDNERIDVESMELGVKILSKVSMKLLKAA